MAEQDQERYRHFLLTGAAATEPFRSPQQGGGGRGVPDRDRQQHGNALRQQLEALRPQFNEAHAIQEDAGIEEDFGLQVEFESFPDIELAFESLARERSGIELLNVRREDQRTFATVFVPDRKLDHFERLIRDYLEERRDSRGRALDNKRLLNTIQQIRAASLRALWTDDGGVFPTSDEEIFWWEVWLPVRGDRAASIEQFRKLARAQDFQIAPGELRFPERTVLLVYGSSGQMQRSIMTLNSIAELRRAKETADFFGSLAPEEQTEWLDDLLDRMNCVEPEEAPPHVCLLDTGVNRGHPLLAPALEQPDLHTIEPAWGTDDGDGHGTAMASLALAGNLTTALASTGALVISHRLESVKLLPADGANQGDARHHGFLTTEAVLRPEVTDPRRRRVFSMAVTARDNRDRGRPSAWSSTIDRLAVDADGEGTNPRLLIVSAGNVNDPNAWAEYPDSNSTDGIHDPGQAWNALTVGACTNLVDITEADAGEYQPIAPSGGLSPFSTTSLTWQPQWPLKPDVVLEGGNAAKDALSAVMMPSLSLLTAHHQSNQRLFTHANATSSATALAARMAARLMAAYPNLWPESIRALIVHSAEWTEAMRRRFLPSGSRPRKRDYTALLRRCGFGLPDFDRAMWSVSDSLTLVCEDSLHPFMRGRGRQPRFRDMNLHRLPWPLAELEALGETQVEMRVTLSYFIEPNPSERGFTSRYRYESHGLRFDVKRPSESENDFRARINAAARDEEEHSPAGGDDPGWIIGKQNRHKGRCTQTSGEVAQRI